MGRRGCSPHRRGAGGLRERGARPAPPGRRRLRRADCGERDGRWPERGERVAVITCGTGGASGRGGSAPGARAAWCRRWDRTAATAGTAPPGFSASPIFPQMVMRSPGSIGWLRGALKGPRRTTEWTRPAGCAAAQPAHPAQPMVEMDLIRASGSERIVSAAKSRAGHGGADRLAEQKRIAPQAHESRPKLAGLVGPRRAKADRPADASGSLRDGAKRIASPARWPGSARRIGAAPQPPGERRREAE